MFWYLLLKNFAAISYITMLTSSDIVNFKLFKRSTIKYTGNNFFYKFPRKNNATCTARDILSYEDVSIVILLYKQPYMFIYSYQSHRNLLVLFMIINGYFHFFVLDTYVLRSLIIKLISWCILDPRIWCPKKTLSYFHELFIVM